MIANYDRATEHIMEIFDDPVFTHAGSNMDLEEIDF
jgi:hypothetical protein